MGSLTQHNPAVWVATSPASSYPPLAGRIDVDVAVVGGGITGLTTALLLKQAGSPSPWWRPTRWRRAPPATRRPR